LAQCDCCGKRMKRVVYNMCEHINDCEEAMYRFEEGISWE